MLKHFPWAENRDKKTILSRSLCYTEIFQPELLAMSEDPFENNIIVYHHRKSFLKTIIKVLVVLNINSY